MNQNSNLAAQETVRQTEVEQEFVRVEECASYIDKIVEELETALSKSILAQRKAVDTCAQSSPEPVRVPVAHRLYMLGGKLDGIREDFSSILSRIEA